MNLSYKSAVVALAFCSWIPVQAATAAVSADEAEKLKSVLTPLGGERAGNKEGTIPAWDGGFTKVAQGYKSDGRPIPDFFANERPRLQVTSKNMGQYSDKLSEGTKELLKRYPGYRLDVYPTHRTAAAPQYVYDNTFKNATRAKVVNQADVKEALGGIPFPIPQNGKEAISNHLFRWIGEAFEFSGGSYLVSGSEPVVATKFKTINQYPYYYKDQNKAPKGEYGKAFVINSDPPFKAGEMTLIVEYSEFESVGRNAWQYLTGQRRVRRAPTIGYDTPNTSTSGYTFWDEVALYAGSPERYDWQIVGKKEMFVPYNTNGFYLKPLKKALTQDYPNPDDLRWELHRVWIVEATLAKGKRHSMPKRRVYLDEDSWSALMAEGWDARSQLWHFAHALPVVVPDLPGVFQWIYVAYDFSKRGYAASSIWNDTPGGAYKILPPKPEGFFTPEALAAGGVR